MKESDFGAEIRRSVPFAREKLNTYIDYTKIPDSFAQSSDTRFTPIKFYDCFLIVKGIHHALELKLSKSISISFDSIREVQETKLQEVEKAGGKGFIVVNFRFEFSDREAFKRGKKQCIASYAVPIKQWMEAKAVAKRKSLNLEWFEGNAINLPKIKTDKGIGWNYTELLENKDK